MSTLQIKQIPASPKKDRCVFLKLEGELVWQNIEEVRQRLPDLLVNHKPVKIELHDVTALDLPFMQLLLAGQKQARALGRTLTIEGELPEDLTLLIHRTGLGGEFGGLV